MGEGPDALVDDAAGIHAALVHRIRQITVRLTVFRPIHQRVPEHLGGIGPLVGLPVHGAQAAHETDGVGHALHVALEKGQVVAPVVRA